MKLDHIASEAAFTTYFFNAERRMQMVDAGALCTVGHQQVWIDDCDRKQAQQYEHLKSDIFEIFPPLSAESLPFGPKEISATCGDCGGIFVRIEGFCLHLDDIEVFLTFPQDVHPSETMISNEGRLKEGNLVGCHSRVRFRNSARAIDRHGKFPAFRVEQLGDTLNHEPSFGQQLQIRIIIASRWVMSLSIKQLTRTCASHFEIGFRQIHDAAHLRRPSSRKICL